MYVSLVRARVRVDFRFHSLMNDIQEFLNQWCPRWASWNLGIFICIRCAGIHRNLGVHISKVKSVNLDQWTQEQVQCVQEMGNTKAKRLYEAFLPECYQRPETDQSAEIFIRDKYDRKKYMDKVINIQMLRKEKSCDNIPKEPVVFEKMKLVSVSFSLPTPSSVSSTKTTVGDKTLYILFTFHRTRMFLESSPYTHVIFASFVTFAWILPLLITFSVHAPLPPHQPVSSSMPQSRVTASVPENLSLFLDMAPKAEGTVKKLSKDSILSLYASTPSVHASLYMNQMGYPTHPSMMGVQQNSMIEVQQNGMMGAQGVTAQPSGMVASSYMTGMSQGMIGQQQHGIMGQQLSGMMGQQQVGGLTTLPHQQVYGAQQSQQLQWNISQMTQHMAGMNLYNTNGMMGSSSPHMGGSTNPSSVHMTAHIWK
uniref:Arf-GAP domain-containing protein n=1 Tax=Scophthalmus maximus TaxID=52904 RepID=A0A8D3CX22_SCOMX